MSTEAARSVVVRVWLPDRPGALGQVASRIGAVHADVTAIDILERGGGRVIDELVVSLPESVSAELLINEIRAVDGVAVEQVRPVATDRSDSATAFLAMAARVASAAAEQRSAELCRGLFEAADADWAVVIDGERILQQVGDAPELGWVVAFVNGSEHLDKSRHGNGPSDVLWARLPRTGLAIAAGRAARPVHERERVRVALVAEILDALLAGREL